MSTDKKISTLEADKERLLDALRELRKEGVTLIDDRVGRPAVLPAKARTEVVNAGLEPDVDLETLLMDARDKLFIEESETDNDPYNKRLK